MPFALAVRRAIFTFAAKSSGQTREDLEEEKTARKCARLAEGQEVASRSETMAGVPKLALDFQPRPATMTSRQLPVPTFYKTGKTRLATAIPFAA